LKPGTWLHHPGNLGQQFLEVLDMFQDLVSKDEVECFVREGKGAVSEIADDVDTGGRGTINTGKAEPFLRPAAKI
jgi:hypothetical protein